jgi:hypothetical protein
MPQVFPKSAYPFDIKRDWRWLRVRLAKTLTHLVH